MTAPALHPELRARLATAGPATVEAARAGLMARYGGLPRAEVGAARDLSIPGPLGPLRLRIYRPKAAGPRPVLVWLHGGGFVVGNLETHDALCRALCAGARAVVVAVDYALAPEHRFPAGLNDCLAAIRWVVGNMAEIGGDPRRLALGGDSAGANLAAVCALELRGEGLAALLLACPVTDAPDPARPSYIERAEGWGLTAAGMDWFFRQYLDDPAQARDPRVAPLRAKDLSALPPTWLLTAEFDPLRDEGAEFARRLDAAGVVVEHLHDAEANHGFVVWAGTTEPSARAIRAACTWLDRRLAEIDDGREQ